MPGEGAIQSLATIAALMLLSACATTPAYLTGLEISSALSDRTATLPGGFTEYYAPDGAVRGISEGQPYTGTWQVKGDAFCTALSGDPPVCSRVSRSGGALLWSPDGDKRPSRIGTILPGNPKGL